MKLVLDEGEIWVVECIKESISIVVFISEKIF